MSRIILLNGSSSSGKTTLALKLQQILPEPYQHISLDQFRDGMPISHRGLNSPAGTPGSEGINVVPRLVEGEPVTDVVFGAWGEKVLSGMRRAVGTFHSNGINVIVDDLLFKSEYLADYVKVLDPHQTWFVGVRCKEDVVRQRESQRLGRFPGTAVAHLEQVHSHGQPYDLEVDTSALPVATVAHQVMARLQQPPQAFAHIRQTIQS